MNQTRISGEILFADDFSDNTGTWDYWHEQEFSAASVHEGKYLMVINENETDIFSTIPGEFADVHLQVAGRKLYGGDDNIFGVVCRYQDEHNYYGFLVSSDGYWSVIKKYAGGQEVLSSTTMEFSENINRGKTENIIEAICKGNYLALVVNGHKLANAIDDTFDTGRIGLTSGSFALDQELAIEFDSFIAMVP